MTKNIILTLSLGLVFISVPVRAQTSYETIFEREERERKEASNGSAEPCYSSDCRYKNDDKSRDDDSTTQLNNSFQQQGTKKGSIGSMVTNQLQPR